MNKNDFATFTFLLLLNYENTVFIETLASVEGLRNRKVLQYFANKNYPN